MVGCVVWSMQLDIAFMYISRKLVQKVGWPLTCWELEFVKNIFVSPFTKTYSDC
jgi:hypothetical protein